MLQGLMYILFRTEANKLIKYSMYFYFFQCWIQEPIFMAPDAQELSHKPTIAQKISQ